MADAERSTQEPEAELRLTRPADVGEVLVAVGGAALAASLFLPWFEPRAVPALLPAPSAAVTGWEAFRVADVLLLAIAVAVVVIALLETASERPTPDLVAALLGWLALAVVIYAGARPHLILRSPSLPLPSIGYFAALASAGAVVVGALWGAISRRGGSA